jgi:uncharacterized metal-binding protein
MESHPEVFPAAEKVYRENEQTAALSRGSAIVENLGYINWPRLRDIIELSRQMKFHHITVAGCIEMDAEIEKTVTILNEYHLPTEGIRCDACLQDDPGGSLIKFAQSTAELHTDFLINLGLCVAAEAQTEKNNRIPQTVFVVRDVKTHNNPAINLYRSPEWKDWTSVFYSKRKSPR